MSNNIISLNPLFLKCVPCLLLPIPPTPVSPSQIDGLFLLSLLHINIDTQIYKYNLFSLFFLFYLCVSFQGWYFVLYNQLRHVAFREANCLSLTSH